MTSASLGDLAGVRAILGAHQSFEFDLEQYLLSLKYADYLRSRAYSYLRLQSGAMGPLVTKAALLDEVRRSLVGTVPAYSRYGAASAFDDLPLISKKDLQGEGYPLIRRDAGAEETGQAAADLWHTTTFGTTAAPVSVYYSSAFHFEYLYLSVWKIAHRVLAPPKPGGIFAVCIDDDPHKPEFVTLDPSGVTGLTMRVFLDPMMAGSLARVFSLVRETGPAVVATRPSLYEALAAYAGLGGQPETTSPGLRCVFSAGSFLTEETRREVGRIFGAPVWNCYGLAEFGFSGGECERLCGYHIDGTSVLVELVDPDGQPVPEGQEGEIVLSSTLNQVMPLIRFRTGDFSVIDHAPCPCGFPGPRLRYVKGHGPFHFRFADGTLLHPARLYPVAWLFPLRDFQVVEEAPGSLHVKVDPAPGAQPDIAERVAALVRHIAPSAASVRVTAGKVDTPGRFERFKSAVPGSLLGRD